MASEKSSLLPNLNVSLDYADQHQAWVVIVAPTTQRAREIRKLAAGCYSRGSITTGRTTLTPNKGRVSVVEATQVSPFPEDTVFTAAFLGWGLNDSDQSVAGMRYWRSQAARILDFASLRDAVYA